MITIENCRDELAARFPNKTLFVNASAASFKGGFKTEYSVHILPGFNYENCQLFTGKDLSECLMKINALTKDYKDIE